MPNIPTKPILLLFVTAIFFTHTGCEKFRDNREVVTASNHALAESSFNDVFKNISLQTSPGGAFVIDSCFSVSWTADSIYPRTLTIDFGSSNCTDLYGIERQGIITAVLSGAFDIAGTVTTVSFSNFYVKNYRIEGTMKITNSGLNASGKQQYGIKVENGIITLNEDGKIVSWNCDYTYVLEEINGTALIFDDVYHITGTASGVNEEGRNFTVEITGTQVKEMNCRWNAIGTIKISPDDLKENELDYNNNDCSSTSNCCDNIAEVSISRRDYTLRMH